MTAQDLIKPKSKWVHIALSKYYDLIKKNPGTWLNILERKCGGDIYGGYLENRSIFFDERHDPKAILHVGIDLWADAGTPVCLPVGGTVIYSRKHSNTLGGWGGRVDIKVKNIVYILGHLEDPQLDAGNQTNKGDTIGLLAPRERNGGWKPHLHIQAMHYPYYKQCLASRIDAYSRALSPKEIQRRYQNPIAAEPVLE